MLNIIQKTGKFSGIGECSRCGAYYDIKDVYGAKKSPIGDLCNKCKTAISSIKTPTQTALLEVFNYDKDTGVITHKYTTNSGIQGEIATYDHSGGYLSICISSKQYLAHRIIYLMVTGEWPEQVDHINHVRQDNRWVNLRNVTNAENNRNTSCQQNSTTDVLGVSLHKPTRKYRAYISVNSKQKHLGLFTTIAAAQAARDLANKQYEYHQNHGE